ncbi:MAG: hypothetical protein IPJ88_12480 [Myxococcales bacterium]|nr:MAG: hypothetical protein IPJ88_12480 [Myxococcales bacterium]
MRQTYLNLAGFCLLICSGLACDLSNNGINPPQKKLNFPTAVALSSQQCGEGPCWLFVANSNFDLRYNHGSVQSIDLTLLAERLQSCDAPPCVYEDYENFLPDGHEVFLGSFAAGIAQSPEGERLFVPLSSDSSLNYIRVASDGSLDCGGRGLPHYCSSEFSRGRSSSDNPRGEVMPRNPVAVLSGDLTEAFDAPPAAGSYVLVGHGNGEVSLFLDQTQQDGLLVPTLVDVVSGFGNGLSSLRYDAYNRTVLATNRLLAQVQKIGIAWDANSAERSFAYGSGSLSIEDLDDGADNRDIWIDAPSKKAYIVARRPKALLIADLERSTVSAGKLALSNVIGVGNGPSRVRIAHVGPESAAYVFVSCFDASALYVIDAELERLRTIVSGLSGPFDIAVDEARELLYVTDFTSSVIRVVDLSPLADGQSPKLLGVLGEARTVKELL